MLLPFKKRNPRRTRCEIFFLLKTVMIVRATTREIYIKHVECAREKEMKTLFTYIFQKSLKNWNKFTTIRDFSVFLSLNSDLKSDFNSWTRLTSCLCAAREIPTWTAYEFWMASIGSIKHTLRLIYLQLKANEVCWTFKRVCVLKKAKWILQLNWASAEKMHFN